MNAESAPLRILFVTSIPRWGGGERWMLESAAGLQSRGHDVQLAARPGAAILQRARETGVSTRAIRMGGDFDPRPLLAMRSLLQRHRPHAVFVNLDKELRYVSMASAFGRRPLVFPRRGSDDPLKHGLLDRYTYGKVVTRILTNCEHLARTRLQAESWLPEDAVRVISNGVDARLDGEEPHILRRQLKLPRNRLLMLHVGELEARKGQETSLRALAHLLQRRADLEPRRKPMLVFIGTGPDESRLRDVCHQLGVQEHVIWVGFRKNVEEYLQAADLLVLPSRREGLPWTILEAMAHGLPVIASAVSGTPEVVQDGVNGLLVAPDDAEALATAMEKVLDDTDLAARLKQGGLDSWRQRWAREDMLTDLECLVYAQLLRRDAPSRSDSRQRAALFVDRDGTLIQNVPYNGDPERVELVPGVRRALRWVRDAGVPVVVVSNQSGVAQGLHSEDDVRAVNSRLHDLLRAGGARIDAFYHCPHHPERNGDCDCRKPAPGMLLRAAREHGLDLRSSWMIGDAQRDLEAGRRAGTQVRGFATQGAATDLSEAEVHSEWMQIVRDFLRTRYREQAAAHP